jgi:phosphopantetheinyl transferase
MLDEDFLLLVSINKINSDKLLPFTAHDQLVDFSKKYQELHLDISDSDIHYLYQFLDSDELARIPKNHLFSVTYIVCRALLKLCLARILKIDIASLKINYGHYGKPFLDDHPVYFNVSKREKFFVIFFSKNECGVDLELTTPINIDAISNHFFSINERLQIKQNNNVERKISEFFNIWVKKESIIKALGGQLSDISQYDTSEKNSSHYVKSSGIDPIKFTTTIHSHSFDNLYLATTILSQEPSP